MFIKLTTEKHKIPMWISSDKIIYFEPRLGNIDDGTTLLLTNGTHMYVSETSEEIAKLLESK